MNLAYVFKARVLMHQLPTTQKKVLNHVDVKPVVRPFHYSSGVKMIHERITPEFAHKQNQRVRNKDRNAASPHAMHSKIYFQFKEPYECISMASVAQCNATPHSAKLRHTASR